MNRWRAIALVWAILFGSLATLDVLQQRMIRQQIGMIEDLTSTVRQQNQALDKATKALNNLMDAQRGPPVDL